jgi:hypothetical protein
MKKQKHLNFKQSVVKLIRGLLIGMMQQVEKIEIYNTNYKLVPEVQVPGR